MSTYSLSLHELSVFVGGVPILQSINLRMEADEQWAIVGSSGSGKTTLAHTLAGRIAYQGKINASFAIPGALALQVAVVEQQHRFRNLANRSDFYYQQRYNSYGADQTMTVEEDLRQHGLKGSEQDGIFRFSQWVEVLKLGPLMQEPLIQLSSGENKRLQILKALLRHPQLLILDQPFAGLDPQGRRSIHELLGALSRAGVRILLITSMVELTDYITHVAVLEGGKLVAAMPKIEFLSSSFAYAKPTHLVIPPVSTWPGPAADFTYAVQLKKVTITYHDKYILHDVDWEVRRGERWSLSGANGAGKSTLLSLLVGDNPQAYANEIYLFDRRRGTGESIWDIKRNIGYVSSELHLYFEPSATCFEVVASGLFDTIGLFRRLTGEQISQVEQWIHAFGLSPQQQKWMHQLGLGEQRMALLARALVKNPPLLILDEPCQGLDEEQTERVRRFLDLYCTQTAATLVYVSHYPAEIPSCVNHFLVLEHGQVLRGC